MGSPAVAAVYRLYDEHGSLLYIGRSRTPDARIAAHRRTNYGWQSAIARWEVEWFGHTSTARRHAEAAVLAERPPNWDAALDPGRRPSRPAWVYRLYDADGVLLRVGSTRNPERRLQDPECRVGVARSSVSEYPTLMAAREAVRRAVEREVPVHGTDRQAVRRESGRAVRARYEGGELSAREALEALIEACGCHPREAARRLGLATGGHATMRSHRTVAKLLELNGLPG